MVELQSPKLSVEVRFLAPMPIYCYGVVGESGLNHFPAKEASGLSSDRGFKSLPLRHKIKSENT